MRQRDLVTINVLAGPIVPRRPRYAGHDVIRYTVIRYNLYISLSAMSPTIKKITLLVSFIAVIAVIAGRTYEVVGERRDKERLPQIGRSIDIGGRSLNIFCTGAGAPPVIL